MSILTLNCGSSSVKFSVFDSKQGDFICRGLVERVGSEESFLKLKQGERELRLEEACPDHTAAVGLVLRVLTEGADSPVPDLANLRAVGHRTVHGGEKFAGSAKVTPQLINALEELSVLAPLHNPPNLSGIRAAQSLLPNIPHVAVFDTAFHQSMEPEAYLYPLPYEWYEGHGVRRYGFHGTSHLFVAHRAAVLLGRSFDSIRVVTLHIGNGASAAAVCCGRSIDTSMGFTPLEGLVMGTRSGSIDPAIPLFIMQTEKLSAAEMDTILNKQSGLFGLTGRFADRRDIEEAAKDGDERCQIAIDVEARGLKKIIGAYAAAMGGIDAVVFTAGVGENSPVIRQKTLVGLQYMGIHLDEEVNAQTRGGKAEVRISKPDSPVRVFVIPTNEERVIAEDTLAICEGRFAADDFSYSFA